MKRTKSWGWPEAALFIVILSLSILIIAVLVSRYVPMPFSPELPPTKTGSTDAIAAHGFRTVFVFSENVSLAAKNYQEELLWSVGPLVVGIIGLLYAGALLIYSLIFNLKPKRTTYIVALVTAVAIWGGIVNLSLLDSAAQHVSDCAHLQNVYDARQYQVTEDIVHVLSVQPASGHARGDSIQVGNASLEIDHFASYCAYGKTIAYGGDLTEGTYARIYYTDYRTILRIDVKEP